MHVLMIAIALTLSLSIRLANFEFTGNWTKDWQRLLFRFSFPPLVLLMTSLAVISMGYQGEMLGLPASWAGYLLAVFLLFYALLSLFKLAYQGWISSTKIRTYPQEFIQGKIARIIKIKFPYSAQVGFWKPELVISEGILEILDHSHLEAVLAHEEAHYNYRDTFWFFWLGWLRYFTVWLPNTEILWQNLLLLREMRADQYAIKIKQIDSLLLAESLLLVAQNVNLSTPINLPDNFCAAFNNNRFVERIDTLLKESDTLPVINWWSWSWLLFIFVPLITVPLHY